MDELKSMTDAELVRINRRLKVRAAELHARFAAQATGRATPADRKALARDIDHATRLLGQVAVELDSRGIPRE